uniref:Cell wall protein RBR3-like n=1 Tax=Cicer arietinum TaxID=3827 RepID=A0A1S3DW44_CICAR|nr:cell wall protein RBR3-like [Cicer arietinum]
MCQHTLIPHCESHEYVSDNDALLIHHLLNCKRLNLLYIILQHMICAATKDYRKNIVPYGMVLTKVFSTNPIPFSSPPTDPEETTEKIATPEHSSPNPERSPPPPERSPANTQTPSTLFAQTSSISSSTIPSYSQTLHSPTHDFGNFLSNPLFSTMSPLFFSPQKTSSFIFGISHFLNFPATVGPSNTSVGPLPSVSSSFASIPSITTTPIPSNTVIATTSQPSTHLHSTPTLTAPSNSDIMAALQIIMARQVQHDQETTILRTWMADHLAPKLGIPSPPPHLIPPPSQVPHPGKSSSSEGSSPSLAS